MPSTPSEQTLADLAARWSKVPTPIRLGDGDIALYDDAFARHVPGAGRDVLLLGSTPELRSLVARRGHRLTGADIAPDFWQAVARLRTDRGPERFIPGDWLDLPVEPRRDVVLADGSFNMLAWPDMKRMIARVATLLKPDGVLITRSQASNPDADLDRLAAAFDDWPGARTGRDFLLAHHCLVESLRSTLRPELTNRGFYEAVVAPLLTPAELDALRPYLRDRPNFYPALDALRAALAAHFEIIEARPSPSERAWGTMHFFVLRPRAQRTEASG